MPTNGFRRKITSLASTWTFKIPSHYTGRDFHQGLKYPNLVVKSPSLPTWATYHFHCSGGELYMSWAHLGTWGASSLRSFRSGIIASALPVHDTAKGTREGWMMAGQQSTGKLEDFLSFIRDGWTIKISFVFLSFSLDIFRRCVWLHSGFFHLIQFQWFLRNPQRLHAFLSITCGGASAWKSLDSRSVRHRWAQVKRNSEK